VRLSHHYGHTREYETAIGYTRRWLALDPLSEAAHRQLMALYDQFGQRASALRQYQICRESLSDELGVEPAEETIELYQKIQVRTLAAAKELRLTHNLPVQVTPFIGRVNELAEIQAKLKDGDCRLLTLLGPGGSGKTRLAIEAARGLLDDYKHGIFFVNLAPLENPDRIPTTIAAALNFSFYEGGTPEEQLLDYLRNKEMLLILDNFEHLLEGGNFVNRILRTASEVKILATSRIRLMVIGEHTFDVWGMAYPESPVVLQIASRKYSAIKLFESEASRVKAGFELNDDNLPDVIEICSLLEGMPLGIMLAANWVMMLAPAEIATEITSDFEFLEEEMSDLPRRQRGMRSTFNYSWRLLSEGEREIMQGLSAFRGGFTRDAAQAIACASLRNLRSLTDQSMIHRTSNGRYEMHELMRQYAAEKLQNDPAIEADIREKHSDYFCQALTIWERELQGPRQATTLQEMTVEIDNIRAAWDWAVEKVKIKTLLGAINGLCFFYNVSHRQRFEGEAICRSLVERFDAIDACEQSRMSQLEGDGINQINRLKLQTRALAWRGSFNAWFGNLDLSLKLIQNCLSLIERSKLAEQDTRFEKAHAYRTLPWVIKNAQQSEKIRMIEEAVDLFESLDEPWLLGSALQGLGLQTRALSRANSIKVFEKSLAVRRKLGDLSGIAQSLEVLSTAYGQICQFEKAEALAYESLAIYQELSNYYRMVVIHMVLGSHLVWQGRFQEARSLYHETLETNRDLVDTPGQASLIHALAGFPEQYLGEYSAASNMAQDAIRLLEKVKYVNAEYGIAIAVSILGRVSLAEGSYVEADKCFCKSLSNYQSHHLDYIGQSQACRGFTARGLNQAAQAQERFYEALSIAVEKDSYLTLTHALPGIALLFADQGDTERAVELYALVSTQGIVANSKWFDDIAGDEIAALAEKLTSEVAEESKARGRELDLWGTSQELLVELEEQGWGEHNLALAPNESGE
jgi:predicted ATPase